MPSLQCCKWVSNKIPNIINPTKKSYSKSQYATFHCQYPTHRQVTLCQKPNQLIKCNLQFFTNVTMRKIFPYLEKIWNYNNSRALLSTCSLYIQIHVYTWREWHDDIYPHEAWTCTIEIMALRVANKSIHRRRNRGAGGGGTFQGWHTHSCLVLSKKPMNLVNLTSLQ
jgi:hypothetical protein